MPPPSIGSTSTPIYIIDAVRTPMGKYRGALASVRTDDLAAHVIEALTTRHAPVVEHIDHVVFGSSNQAGEDNRNVARMALLLAGLPYSVPAVTVNRLCGSGLEAIASAARMIAVGEASCAIAGGVESMSRAPYVMPKPTAAYQRGAPQLYDTSLGWRFKNPKMAERFELISLGDTAENLSKKHAVSREDQDAFALQSHARAVAATESGKFAAEIVPVSVPQRKGDAITIDRDESIRPNSTVEKLAALEPVFRKGGSVTAGNSSPLSDGAAAVLLASGSVVKRLGVKPMVRVVVNATSGVAPNYMGEGPIPAVRTVFERAGLRSPNIDLVELNEAFAVQALACMRALDLHPDRVNVNGGAIALGHPVGCSGARIMTTLVHAMQARDANLGIASLCIGTGQGIATLVERDKNCV